METIFIVQTHNMQRFLDAIIRKTGVIIIRKVKTNLTVASSPAMGRENEIFAAAVRPKLFSVALLRENRTCLSGNAPDL